MIAPKLYPFHSLLWIELYQLLQECSWNIKQGLATVQCNTEDLVMIGLVCVFLDVFLSALYFRATYFKACAPFRHVPYVPECPWEGLGNIWGYEWGTSSEGGAILCHVECITPSFLAFFQFGENTQ